MQTQEPATAKPHPPRPRATASPSSFRIRPATAEDMNTAAALVRSSAHWYRPILHEKDMAEHEVDEAWARKNFARRDFYLGIAGKTPVGVLSTQYFGDYLYIGYLYLDVDQVGHGYGGELLRFAEQLARRRGARGMCLIAHPEATWAKRAYSKYGFEVVETTKAGVLRWQGGVLRDYYEEGFELHIRELESKKLEGDEEGAGSRAGAPVEGS